MDHHVFRRATGLAAGGLFLGVAGFLLFDGLTGHSAYAATACAAPWPGCQPPPFEIPGMPPGMKPPPLPGVSATVPRRSADARHVRPQKRAAGVRRPGRTPAAPGPPVCPTPWRLSCPHPHPAAGGVKRPAPESPVPGGRDFPLLLPGVGATPAPAGPRPPIPPELDDGRALPVWPWPQHIIVPGVTRKRPGGEPPDDWRRYPGPSPATVIVVTKTADVIGRIESIPTLGHGVVIDAAKIGGVGAKMLWGYLQADQDVRAGSAKAVRTAYDRAGANYWKAVYAAKTGNPPENLAELEREYQDAKERYDALPDSEKYPADREQPDGEQGAGGEQRPEPPTDSAATGRPAEETPVRPDHDREAGPAEPDPTQPQPGVGRPAPDPTAPMPVEPVPEPPAPEPAPQPVPYSPPPIVWTPPGVDNVPEEPPCCGPTNAPLTPPKPKPKAPGPQIKKRAGWGFPNWWPTIPFTDVPIPPAGVPVPTPWGALLLVPVVEGRPEGGTSAPPRPQPPTPKPYHAAPHSSSNSVNPDHDNSGRNEQHGERLGDSHEAPRNDAPDNSSGGSSAPRNDSPPSGSSGGGSAEPAPEGPGPVDSGRGNGHFDEGKNHSGGDDDQSVRA